MPGRLIGRFFVMVVLLVIEVFVTMLVYTFLNLRFVETFGTLVGLSRTVLNGMASLVVTAFPASAKAAEATLLGELSPKAMLLLLVGLVVATVVRGLAELTGLMGHRH